MVLFLLRTLTNTHTYDSLPSFSVLRKKCLPSFQGKWCLLIHLQLPLGPSFEWLLSRHDDIYLQIHQQTPLTPNWLTYSAIKSLRFYICVLLLITTKESKMALAFYAFLLSQISLILQAQAQLPSALSLHPKLTYSCLILLYYYHTIFSNYSIVTLCISFLSLIFLIINVFTFYLPYYIVNSSNIRHVQNFVLSLHNLSNTMPTI